VTHADHPRANTPDASASQSDPTLFEWAGGFAALHRMTQLFYEKYAPNDPLLAPVFANIGVDHPKRVATWFAEVFGGPKTYTERYGGYDWMVSRHVGRALTEEQRARWAQLMCQCADEAGLPTDPEFKAAFVSYIEWGSRIALENSTPGAKPPMHMPVPRWWWVCDATPGARVSALVPQSEEGQAVTTPDAGEAPSFENHIKPLFRERDRGSMKFAFDLWSHEDVSAHADAILTKLREGSMPCDGSWPSDRVKTFERWVAAGKPE
jgi:truncated hemoglobin YjbI